MTWVPLTLFKENHTSSVKIIQTVSDVLCPPELMTSFMKQGGMESGGNFFFHLPFFLSTNCAFMFRSAYILHPVTSFACACTHTKGGVTKIVRFRTWHKGSMVSARPYLSLIVLISVMLSWTPEPPHSCTHTHTHTHSRCRAVLVAKAALEWQLC